MRCERCYGIGKLQFAQRPNGFREFMPCPECGGCGFQNCCEGERAQPDGAPSREIIEEARKICFQLCASLECGKVGYCLGESMPIYYDAARDRVANRVRVICHY